MLDEKDGWTVAHNKWFELIVFEFYEDENGTRHMFELYYETEVAYEYDEDTFNAWIDQAIAQDNEEE